MSSVINLHEVRQAKADGVFAAVNIAARNMGYSDAMAESAAVRARREYRMNGQASQVVSARLAKLRWCGGGSDAA